MHYVGGAVQRIPARTPYQGMSGCATEGVSETASYVGVAREEVLVSRPYMGIYGRARGETSQTTPYVSGA